MIANARAEAALCPMPDVAGIPEGGAWGVVCSATTREPLVGVTATVAGKVAITSEKGVFFVPIAPGDYEIVFYYGDCTIRTKVHVGAGPTSPLQQSIDASRC